jgi:hypothetical protein
MGGGGKKVLEAELMRVEIKGSYKKGETLIGRAGWEEKQKREVS